MPLDPNIITYGLRQMPGVDINAMVQQQITGMENINELERQRQADALALQDRAAKQQAEAAQMQEAEAMRALLPAYTYGIQTGDIVGAGNLAPPEMRGQLQPFIDALTGKSPQEVQAALIGSLASSGEVGQEALAAIQRAQTAQIQQGQLDVSREDIKLRRQKQALDAEGNGAWELKEGDGGFFWTNSRTREVVPADVTGGAAPSAIPTPDVVTPRQPAPEMPEAALPAGAAQPPTFRPKPKAGSAEQTQEERRRAASVRYAVKNVEKVLQTIDKDPASFGQGADEFALSLIPFGAGEDFKSFVQDANREQVYYRMNQTVATLLRLATGAAFTTPELVTEASSFMPKFGDDPATARDKLDALQDRVLSEVGSTGRGFTPEDQAELNALLGAFETMKNKLYPEEAVGGSSVGAGEIDLDNPLLKD